VNAPGRIAENCPRCQKRTAFQRVATAASVRTGASKTSVAQAARSSQRGSTEREVRRSNIQRGLTGDGRPLNNLQQRSAEAWTSAFSASNPSFEQPD